MKLLTNVKITNVVENFDPELKKLADEQGERCPSRDATVHTNHPEMPTFMSTDPLIKDDFDDGELAEDYTLLIW